MAWSNPFRVRDKNTRTCWGYTFELTDDHLTLETSHLLKFSYDRLGEETLNVLNDLCPPQRQTTDQASNLSKRDLYVLLRDNAKNNPVLERLWQEVTTVPLWVDWEQIARGQDVFYRYGGPALTGLAFQSLLGGMGAHRVVEVLARTGGFSTSVARHRLFETTQYILQCTQSLESLQPGGAGFASSIRVRLLHAAVRQRIMKLAAQRPEYYDVATLGVPINDLDCIATISTFSATLVWLGFPRQGIWLREREVVDYIALFRYVGYLTGTPTEWFETPVKARAAMESLLMNEIKPTETGKILASNILSALEGRAPGYASREFLEATSRWLNGNELCDALGLGRPSLYYWCLSAGQCMFFMCICYTYRSIPWLDRRKITALRNVFWAMIVEGKHGLRGEKSVFNFKYIPHLDKTTRLEKMDKFEPEQPGSERRNLQFFMIGCVLTSIMAYLGYTIACRLLGYLTLQIV